MTRVRTAVVAIAAMCVMASGAASASAAITVGPGVGPFAETVTLPKSGDGFRFTHGGITWPCGANFAGTWSSTGAVSVSSMAEDLCAGAWTFHPPFSGQIVGSPGNYAMQIPISYRYVNIVTCEFSGTIRIPVTSGSTVVGAASGQMTAPVTATCPPTAMSMLISGITAPGGTLSLARSIFGTL